MSSLNDPPSGGYVAGMTTILDLPEARGQGAGQVARFSVEEFHSLAETGVLDKRTQLIRGFIFEPMPMSPLHRQLSMQLYDDLRELPLPGMGVFHESPLTLHDSEPMPDVMVVRETNAPSSTGTPPAPSS